MFSKICFCIGDGQIEFEKYRFSLGEISTQILNITPEQYHKLKHKLSCAKEKLAEFESTSKTADLKEANKLYFKLREALCDSLIFYTLADESEIIYNTVEDEKGETVPDSHWQIYKKHFDAYEQLLFDIASFNQTIHFFIKNFLSALKKLNLENYAAALNDFLYSDRSWKYIANPIGGTGLFTNADEITLRHVPRETYPGSDEYKIFEYYDVSSFQALLKLDFYKALESGYIIRCCQYCGRYFLLKKAYHTKYCNTLAPGNDKYTCAQLAYHSKGVKEATPDNPKAQSLRRCLERIDKDHYRGIISDEEKEKLEKKANDLYFRASTKDIITADEFEEQLASKNLYPLCNVERVTAPRGRPKKKKQSEISD